MEQVFSKRDIGRQKRPDGRLFRYDMSYMSLIKNMIIDKNDWIARIHVAIVNSSKPLKLKLESTPTKGKWHQETL